MMAAMARPMKLTEERRTRIINALRTGNYQEVAARHGGLGISTFYRYVAFGKTLSEAWDDLTDEEQAAEDPVDKMYREFYDAVEEAKTEAEVRHIALINKAAQEGTWQASAWWLERTRPKKYGRFDRNEITGADGGPLAVDVSTEDLERKVLAVLAARGEDPDA